MFRESPTSRMWQQAFLWLSHIVLFLMQGCIGNVIILDDIRFQGYTWTPDFGYWLKLVILSLRKYVVYYLGYANILSCISFWIFVLKGEFQVFILVLSWTIPLPATWLWLLIKFFIFVIKNPFFGNQRSHFWFHYERKNK